MTKSTFITFVCIYESERERDHTQIMGLIHLNRCTCMFSWEVYTCVGIGQGDFENTDVSGERGKKLPYGQRHHDTEEETPRDVRCGLDVQDSQGRTEERTDGEEMDHGDCHGVGEHLKYLLDEDIVGGTYRVPTDTEKDDLHRLTYERLLSHLHSACSEFKNTYTPTSAG